MSTSQRRRYAAAQARDLLKIARTLIEPASTERMTQNAVNAQVLVNRIVWALTAVDDKPSGTISPKVQPDLQDPMQALAEVILDALPGKGYALLAWDWSDEPGGTMNYVSNALRDNIVVAMREFIAAHEERIQPAPETPQ